MAALGFTKKGRIPFGNYWLVFGRTSALGAGSGVEWIAAKDLGLKSIVSAMAAGTGNSVGSISQVQLNAQGTSVAEGTNPGDLGIRTAVAHSAEVWVVGT